MFGVPQAAKSRRTMRISVLEGSCLVLHGARKSRRTMRIGVLEGSFLVLLRPRNRAVPCGLASWGGVIFGAPRVPNIAPYHAD